MPQRSIVRTILPMLERYLERLDEEWEAQAEGARQPTLPLTVDGKVNVRALTRALGLRESQEQHFYRHKELATAVNAIARVQGVKKIGSRMLDDEEDDLMAERIHRVETRSSDLARELSEREALIERYRQENASLREQLRLLEETGMVLRVGEVR